MRECEIDLGLSTGRRLWFGSSSGRHTWFSSVRGRLPWTALAGKAALAHYSSRLVSVDMDFDGDDDTGLSLRSDTCV